ncbi:MAG: acyl-CoA reductase [Chitinophagaceae bacterium]|nr:MAG: acyl-CoA reductase [Chitinophagaceae bacterium]
MNLQERKDLLVQLGRFMQTEDEGWQAAKRRATNENPWFLTQFIDLSVNNICEEFLTEEKLQSLIDRYKLGENLSPKKVGLVMAGNIPLVGFHDLLCTFITGHYAMIKLSSKDDALLRFLIKQMISWNGAAEPYFTISVMLKNCDAYIATGSNNSSTYFAYYFARYPHIIRKNRTSVAVLTGEESEEELEALADDVYQYFGLGCRNVTKIMVPREYNFEPLLASFKKYNYLFDYQKYKNNYDYNLAIHLLNKKYFMSSGSILLVEDPSPFSPIAQLHYEYYDDIADARKTLVENDAIQCVVGKEGLPFGSAQKPGICNFADGVDTIAFLKDLQEVRSS